MWEQAGIWPQGTELLTSHHHYVFEMQQASFYPNAYYNIPTDLSFPPSMIKSSTNNHNPYCNQSPIDAMISQPSSNKPFHLQHQSTVFHHPILMPPMLIQPQPVFTPPTMPPLEVSGMRLPTRIPSNHNPQQQFTGNQSWLQQHHIHNCDTNRPKQQQTLQKFDSHRPQQEHTLPVLDNNLSQEQHNIHQFDTNHPPQQQTFPQYGTNHPQQQQIFPQYGTHHPQQQHTLPQYGTSDPQQLQHLPQYDTNHNQQQTRIQQHHNQLQPLQFRPQQQQICPLQPQTRLKQQLNQPQHHPYQYCTRPHQPHIRPNQHQSHTELPDKCPQQTLPKQPIRSNINFWKHVMNLVSKHYQQYQIFAQTLENRNLWRDFLDAMQTFDNPLTPSEEYSQSQRIAITFKRLIKQSLPHEIKTPPTIVFKTYDDALTGAQSIRTSVKPILADIFRLTNCPENLSRLRHILLMQWLKIMLHILCIDPFSPEDNLLKSVHILLKSVHTLLAEVMLSLFKIRKKQGHVFRKRQKPAGNAIFCDKEVLSASMNRPETHQPTLSQSHCPPLDISQPGLSQSTNVQGSDVLQSKTSHTQPQSLTKQMPPEYQKTHRQFSLSSSPDKSQNALQSQPSSLQSSLLSKTSWTKVISEPPLDDIPSSSRQLACHNAASLSVSCTTGQTSTSHDVQKTTTLDRDSFTILRPSIYLSSQENNAPRCVPPNSPSNLTSQANSIYLVENTEQPCTLQHDCTISSEPDNFVDLNQSESEKILRQIIEPKIEIKTEETLNTADVKIENVEEKFPNFLFDHTFNCPVCSTNCGTDHNLVSHMLVQHSDVETIICTLCSRLLAKENLFRHIHSTHLSTNCQFVCGGKTDIWKCKFNSKDKWALYLHMQIDHDKEDSFDCHKCGFSTPSIADLLDHLQNCGEDPKESIVSQAQSERKETSSDDASMYNTSQMTENLKLMPERKRHTVKIVCIPGHTTKAVREIIIDRRLNKLLSCSKPGPASSKLGSTPGLERTSENKNVDPVFTVSTVVSTFETFPFEKKINNKNRKRPKATKPTSSTLKSQSPIKIKLSSLLSKIANKGKQKIGRPKKGVDIFETLNTKETEAEVLTAPFTKDNIKTKAITPTRLSEELANVPIASQGKPDCGTEIKSLWYSCNECDYSGESLFQFRTHLVQHASTGDKLAPLKQTQNHLKCGICGYFSDGQKDFSLHFKRHLTEKGFLCTHCLNDFVSLEAVKSHWHSYHPSDLFSYIDRGEMYRGMCKEAQKIVLLNPLVVVTPMDIMIAEGRDDDVTEGVHTNDANFEDKITEVVRQNDANPLQKEINIKKQNYANIQHDVTTIVQQKHATNEHEDISSQPLVPAKRPGINFTRKRTKKKYKRMIIESDSEESYDEDVYYTSFKKLIYDLA